MFGVRFVCVCFVGNIIYFIIICIFKKYKKKKIVKLIVKNWKSNSKYLVWLFFFFVVFRCECIVGIGCFGVNRKDDVIMLLVIVIIEGLFVFFVC